MSWKEWTAVGLVIGVGVVLQIPVHDDGMAEQNGSSHLTEMAPDQVGDNGPYRSIALEVTGMT